MIKYVLVILVSFLCTHKAQASYAIADLQVSVNPNAPTRIIVSGQGLEAGSTWLSAGHTQALKYKDYVLDENIKLVTAVNSLKSNIYLSKLNLWGYKNIQYVNKDFLGADLVQILLNTNLISSIDFVGHNGAFLGFALESEDPSHRFYRSHVDALVGKIHFTNDAYVRIFGCNTGWVLAPYIASRLNVLAIGTLTSADVQLLGNDGRWYYDEDQLWPQGVKAAVTNSSSYLKASQCDSQGGCVRLKPIWTNYVGKRGTYTGSLPFLKSFCGASLNMSECSRRMANSLKYWPSEKVLETNGKPNLNNYAEVLSDLFCSQEINISKRNLCVTSIINHVTGGEKVNSNFTMLNSDQTALTCDFIKCQFKVAQDKNGQNVFVGTGPALSTTLVNELEAYINGYNLL